MPQLPSLDQPLAIPQARRPIVTYDATAVPRAQAQLGAAIGGGIEKVASGIIEKQDRYNYAQAKSSFLQAQVELENQLDQDPDYQTYAQRYTAEMGKARDAALKLIRDPNDRALFQQDLDLDIQRGLGAVQKKARSREIDTERGQLMSTISSNREMALRAGDEVSRMRIIQATQEAIEGAKERGYLSDQEAVKWRQSATEDYATASIDMLDPAGRVAALSKSGIADLIPSDTRAKMKMQAEKQIEAERKQREIEARQLQAIAKAELSSQVQDATSAYLAGFEYDNPPSESQFRAAYGEKGGEMYAQFQKTQDVGLAIRELATATPEDRQRMVEQFSPAQEGVAGEGFRRDSQLYGTLVNAAVRLEKERAQDPAMYALKYSQPIQQAWEAASTGDTAASEAYAAATLAEQQRLGVPQPRILTDRQVAGIAAQFGTVEDGGSNAATLIQQLQQQWGKNWPTVYGQLQSKLPGAAMVIGTGVDEKTAATLARIAPLKTTELKAGLASIDTKDANEALNEAMAPFRHTLAGQVGGERTYATMRAEAERLAYAYMGQGQSPSDAAAQATTAMIEDKYTIVGTWRAPKQLDADLIEDGAELAIEGLDVKSLAFAAPKGVSAEFAESRVRDAISRDGYWVTLPDESGLALYYGGEAVLDKAGNPIARSWDELTGAASQNPSAWQRFEEGRKKMSESPVKAGARQ